MLFTYRANTIGPLLIVQQLLKNKLIGRPGSIVGNVTSKVPGWSQVFCQCCQLSCPQHQVFLATICRKGRGEVRKEAEGGDRQALLQDSGVGRSGGGGEGEGGLETEITVPQCSTT